MSNNITSWRTKKIRELSIPLSALYGEDVRPDWRPDAPTILLNGDKGYKEYSRVNIHLCEDGYIIGTIIDGIIWVDTIKLRGESSGREFYIVIEPALHQSTGELEAVLIYESSDIIRLYVKDGKVTQTDVEL